MGVPITFQNVWSTWQAVAIAAAVLSLLFAAIAYMLASFFRTKDLEVWAKEEVYQALGSAFIIAIAVVAVSLLIQTACTLTGGCPPGGDHLDVAINILENMKDKAVLQTQYLYELSVRVGFMSKMGKYYDFTFGPPSGPCLVGECQTAFGWSWYMWAGGSIVAESLDYAFTLLVPMVSSFYAQLWLLKFIQAILFPSLLGLGIVLRTFFFTRKVGGLLIAIALGLYTVYPLMYVMLGSYMDFAPHKFYYPSSDWTFLFAPISCWGSDYFPGGSNANAPWCTGFAGMLSFIIPGLPTAVGNFGNVDYMFRNGCIMPPAGGYTANDPNVCYKSTCSGEPNAVAAVLNPLGDTTNFCNTDPSPDVYAGMRSPYDGVLPTVGYLMVPAVFIPLIIILVTIAFIRNLSPMLGGDVEIAGLTKIL